MKKRLKLKQNSASIMLRSFVLLTTVIILISGIITIFAVGNQLLETSQSSTNNIIKSLKKTDIDGDDDWENWRANNSLDTSTSYVLVHNMRKDANTKFYYSPDTEDLLSTKPRKVPLIKHLYYRPHMGFLYYATGHAKGINYKLWVKLNSQFATLERVVIVTAAILLLTLLISPLYIQFVADRLTGSLTKLTKSAEESSADMTQQVSQLPVPESPTEVATLATSFNRLLMHLHKQSEKEKLFISNAAHELRTPIATIQTHAQLIKRRGKEHPEIVAKSIDYINDESHQMGNLVDELLALTRADRMALDFKKYNLSNSLVQVKEKMTPLLKQTIITNIPENITIAAHEGSVEQILINLISNAGKYSDSTSKINLRLKKTTDFVAIEVADQGEGISSEDAQHIFERFYRSSDIRGSIPGTGLGLAIAKQLADLNHAELTFTSNKPHGTIFTLKFKN